MSVMQPTVDRHSDAGGDGANGADRFNMPFIWGISLVAAMGGLLFGYDFVVIAGAKPFYEKFFLITSQSLSGWAVSCALVGCLIGAVASGGLSDRYGRKRLLILAAVLFTTSSIGTGMANEFSTFVVWRIIGGTAIGLASNLSPMYIAEVAPANLRGRLVAINQLTIVIGSLTAQIVNWQVAEQVPNKLATPAAIVAKVENLKTLANRLEAGKGDSPARQMVAADVARLERASRDLQSRYPQLDLRDKSAVVKMGQDTDSKRAVDQLDDLARKVEWWEIYDSWNGRTGWRWMFTLTAIPSLLFFGLMFFVPESPRWLAKNGKPAKAQRTLARIGGAAYARRAIDEIEATLVDEVEKVDFRDLLDLRMRKVLLIGVVLALFQQWCGINILYNYPDVIFTQAGYGVSDLMFNIVVTGVVNLAAMLIAIFTIDRFGRRFLMLAGAAGLGLIYLMLGGCFYFHSQGIHVLLLIIAAIACFAFSLGPATWVIISEIFPNRIRGAAVSVSVFALWFGCFTLVYAFPSLTTCLGMANSFWLFSAVCLVGFGFIWHKLPETKGKSLEQIERELVD